MRNAEHWRASYIQQQDDYVRLSQNDPGSALRDAKMIMESFVSAQLRYAVKVALGCGPDWLVERFLRNALAYGEALQLDPRWRQQSPFALREGELLVRLGIVKGALGQGAQDSMFIGASRAYVSYCSAVRPWDDSGQEQLLHGVRAALMGGDIGQAHRAVRSRRSFGYYPEDATCLRAVIASRGSGELLGGAMFARRFDKVRDPSFRTPIFTDGLRIAVEMSMLRQRLSTGAVSWTHTVAEVRT